MAGGTVNLAVKTTNDSSGLRAASADLENFGKNAAAAGAGLDTFDKKQAAAARNLESNITKASAVASVGILAIGGLAVKTAADFERSMDQVGAVAGATASEMTQLSGAAKQIGADTAFSASQAAAAMEELAAGGRSVTQILNGEARAAVDLAAAGNYDLAQSGRTIATVMDVWRNTQIDTNDVVNRLAGAANASRFGVEDMSGAIAQAGGVAAGLGVEFDDFTAAIAATASSFASGSDAGTSYKVFLTSLDGSTDKAKQAIADLGLEFRNSNGDLKSTAEIAQELADKVGILGEAEKVAALKTIFGNDAMRTALGLMDQQAEGVQKVNDILANTNASDIAEQRMSNLAGSFEEFKGSAETLAISLGEKALPAMTNMADAGTAALNAFGGLPESTQGMALGFTALAVAAPAAVALVGKMAENAKALKTVMSGGASMATLGPAFSTAAIGIGALAISVDALLQKTKGYGLGELVFGNPRAASAGNQFNKDLEHTLEITRGAGVEIDVIATAMDKYTAAIAENADKSQSAADKRQGITEALAGSLMAEEASVWELKAAYDEIGRTYEANGLKAEAAQATFDNETKVLEKYALAVDDMNVKMAASFNAIEDANAGVVLSTENVAAAIPPATTALDDFRAGLEEGANWSNELSDRLDQLAGRFATLDPQVAINNVNLAILKEELADAERNGTGFSQALGMTKEQMEGAIKVLDDNNAALGENEQAYKDIMGAMQALEGPAGVVAGSVLNIDEAIQGANLSSEEQITLAGQVGQALGVLATDDIPKVVDALLTIGETSPEAMQAFVDGITDPAKKEAIVSHIEGIAPEVGAKLRAGMQTAGEEGSEALAAGISAGISDVELAGFNAGFAASSGFQAGINANAAAAIGAAVAMAQNAVAGVRTVLQSQSPSKVFMSIGRDSGEGYALGLEASEPRVMRASEAMVGAGIDGATRASDGYSISFGAARDGYGVPAGNFGGPLGAMIEDALGGTSGWINGTIPKAAQDMYRAYAAGAISQEQMWEWLKAHGYSANHLQVNDIFPDIAPAWKPKPQPGGHGITAPGEMPHLPMDPGGNTPIGTYPGGGEQTQADAEIADAMTSGFLQTLDPKVAGALSAAYGAYQAGTLSRNEMWNMINNYGFQQFRALRANGGLSVYQDSAGAWRDLITGELATGADGRFLTSGYQQDAVKWISNHQSNPGQFTGRGLLPPEPAKQSDMAKFWAKVGMSPRSMSNDPFRMNSFDFFTERGDWAALGYGEGSEWSSDPWYGDVPKEWLKTAAGQEYLALRGIDPMNNPATRADYNRWHPNAMGGGGTRVRKGSGFETVYRRESADNTPKQIVINVQAWDTQSFLRAAPQIREALAIDERSGY